MTSIPANERTRARSLEELEELNAKLFDGSTFATAMRTYKPEPSDVIITPFAKCGTTWTQQIFHSLRTRGDMDFDDISRVVPWIETATMLGLDINAEQRATPRGFKSHLGYNHIPKGAKYINVIRHPVDAAYSSFKFTEGWFLEPGTVTADDYVRADLPKWRYFEHFLSWWPHRDDETVLYLVYEHMRDDLPRAVRQIAEFIGVELDDELFAIACENGSFEFMSRHKDRFDDAIFRRLSEESVLPPGSDSAKVRAGQVGVTTLGQTVIDEINGLWRKHVTPETGFETYEYLIASLK